MGVWNYLSDVRVAKSFQQSQLWRGSMVPILAGGDSPFRKVELLTAASLYEASQTNLFARDIQGRLAQTGELLAGLAENSELTNWHLENLARQQLVGSALAVASLDALRDDMNRSNAAQSEAIRSLHNDLNLAAQAHLDQLSQSLQTQREMLELLENPRATEAAELKRSAKKSLSQLPVFQASPGAVGEKAVRLLVADAKKQLSESAELWSQDPEVLILLGSLIEEFDANAEKAEEYFALAVMRTRQENPLLAAVALHNIAEIRNNTGKFGEAVSAIDEALGLLGKLNPLYLFDRARYLVNAGRADEGASNLVTAIKASPGLYAAVLAVPEFTHPTIISALKDITQEEREALAEEISTRAATAPDPRGELPLLNPHSLLSLVRAAARENNCLDQLVISLCRVGMVLDAKQILISSNVQGSDAWTETIAALSKKGLFSVATGLIDRAPDKQRDELRCTLLDALWKAGRMDLAMAEVTSLGNEYLTRRWGTFAAIRYLVRSGRVDQAMLVVGHDAASHDQQSYYVLAEECVKANRPDLVAQIVEQHPTVIDDDMWPTIIDPGVIGSLLHRGDYDGALRWCSNLRYPSCGIYAVAYHAEESSDLGLATRLLNDLPDITLRMKLSDHDEILRHVVSVIALMNFRSAMKQENIDEALEFLSNVYDSSHKDYGSSELGKYALEHELAIELYEKSIIYSDINAKDYMPMVLQCAKYVRDGSDLEVISSEIAKLLSREDNYIYFGNLDECCSPLFKQERFWEILCDATLKCVKTKNSGTILQWFFDIALCGAHALMTSGQSPQAPLQAVNRALGKAKSVDSRYKAYIMFGTLFTDGAPNQEAVLRQLAELSNALVPKEWVVTVCRLAEYLHVHTHGMVPTWNRSEQREEDYHDL